MHFNMYISHGSCMDWYHIEDEGFRTSKPILSKSFLRLLFESRDAFEKLVYGILDPCFVLDYSWTTCVKLVSWWPEIRCAWLI
jgi:hypothetical protein